MCRNTLFLSCLAGALVLAAGCNGDATGIDRPGQAPEFSLQLPAGADAAADAIDEATLRSIVETLSSDEMAGRGPAAAGDLAARAYLIDFLDSLGAQPGAANGSWEQPLGLVSVTASMPETWSFHAGDKSVTLAWWDEYVASSAVQEDHASIEDAELVFVGYGITAPEENWDDYKGANDDREISISGSIGA